MPDIIFSSLDKASQTIFQQIIFNFNFEELNETFEGNKIYVNNNIRLITTNKPLIYSDHLDLLKSDLLIFASRHKSDSGNPSLLVHCTGNWGNDAKFGGNPRELGNSVGSAIKIALMELQNQKEILELDRFDVSIEVSHHGPTQLITPLIFIELGSTPKDWGNKTGALAVANAIIKVAKSNKKFKNYIGIGGSHYAPKFTKLVINPNLNFTISHIIPKYMLDYINRDMISKSIDRSMEKIEKFVLDWKGMNSNQRQKIILLIESINYEYEKAKSFKI